MQDNGKLVMDIPEFSRKFNISVNLAYDLARADKLPVPVIFLGARRMVLSRRQVDELLNQRKQEASRTTGELNT